MAKPRICSPLLIQRKQKTKASLSVQMEELVAAGKYHKQQQTTLALDVCSHPKPSETQTLVSRKRIYFSALRLHKQPSQGCAKLSCARKLLLSVHRPFRSVIFQLYLYSAKI